MPRNELIEFRRDTLADWTSVNPIIAEGEPFYVLDTGEFGIGTGAAFLSTPRSLVGAADDFTGSLLTSGFVNQPRGLAISSHQVLGSGGVYLTYFRAPRSLTVANIKMVSGTTAAGATPSLVKYGLFSVAANGDITRIGITASDTAIFAAASTAYTRALLATADVVAGNVYASAMLTVTAAAAPSVISTPGVSAGSSGALAAVAPRLNGIVLAQADIAASYTAAQVTNATPRYYAELLPA